MVNCRIILNGRIHTAAGASRPARWAGAGESVDEIRAVSVVEAGLRLALIDVNCSNINILVTMSIGERSL